MATTRAHTHTQTHKKKGPVGGEDRKKIPIIAAGTALRHRCDRHVLVVVASTCLCAGRLFASTTSTWACGTRSMAAESAELAARVGRSWVATAPIIPPKTAIPRPSPVTQRHHRLCFSPSFTGPLPSLGGGLT